VRRIQITLPQVIGEDDDDVRQRVRVRAGLDAIEVRLGPGGPQVPASGVMDLPVGNASRQQRPGREDGALQEFPSARRLGLRVAPRATVRNPASRPRGGRARSVRRGEALPGEAPPGESLPRGRSLREQRVCKQCLAPTPRRGNGAWPLPAPLATPRSRPAALPTARCSPFPVPARGCTEC